MYGLRSGMKDNCGGTDEIIVSKERSVGENTSSKGKKPRQKRGTQSTPTLKRSEAKFAKILHTIEGSDKPTEVDQRPPENTPTHTDQTSTYSTQQRGIQNPSSMAEETPTKMQAGFSNRGNRFNPLQNGKASAGMVPIPELGEKAVEMELGESIITESHEIINNPTHQSTPKGASGKPSGKQGASGSKSQKRTTTPQESTKRRKRRRRRSKSTLESSYTQDTTERSAVIEQIDLSKSDETDDTDTSVLEEIHNMGAAIDQEGSTGMQGRLLNLQFERMLNTMKKEMTKCRTSLKTDLTASIVQTLNKKVEKELKVAKEELRGEISTKMSEIHKESANKLSLMEGQMLIRDKETTGQDNRLAVCEKGLAFISAQYDSMTKWQTDLTKDRKREEGEIVMIIDKVLATEQNDIKHDEDINRLERERRANNFRISKLPETQPKEDTRKVVGHYIWTNRILEGNTSEESIINEIEYAYRIGKQNSQYSRQILVRMFSKANRDEIVIRARRRSASQKMKPVFFQDDLCPTDHSNKREGNNIMKEAHDRKFEPRFQNGKFVLKINEANVELSIEDVRRYNRGLKLDVLIHDRQILDRNRRKEKENEQERRREVIANRRITTPIRRSSRQLTHSRPTTTEKSITRPRLSSVEEIREDPTGTIITSETYLEDLERQVKAMREIQKSMAHKTLTTQV